MSSNSKLKKIQNFAGILFMKTSSLETFVNLSCYVGHSGCYSRLDFTVEKSVDKWNMIVQAGIGSTNLVEKLQVMNRN